MAKRKGQDRYYCQDHLNRGGCANGRGVPALLLEQAVIAKLDELLCDERHWRQYWALAQEQSERERIEQESRPDAHAAKEKQVAKLEAAVEHLLDRAEVGQAVGDRIKLWSGRA